MSKESFNIEEFFQNAFDAHEVNPSTRALKGLRKKLWKRDFFSLKLSHFNIYYTILLLAGVSTGYFVANNSPESNSPVNTVEVQHEKAAAGKNITNKTELNSAEEQPISRKNESEEEVITPEAEFTMSAMAGCAPLKVELKNTSHNAKAITWYLDEKEEISSPNTTYIFNEPGTHTIRLQAISVSGNADQEVREVIVHSRPKAGFSIDEAKSSNTQKTIQFENKSKNADEYLWLFGDGQSSREKEPLHQYSNYQSYNVKLIATSENACKDTSELTANFLKEQYGLSYPQNFVPGPQGRQNNGYYHKADWPESIFHPQYNGVSEYSLTIKAPNGMEVFRTDNINQGWNGYIHGRLAPNGQYIWHAEGKYVNGEPFSLNGRVTVKHEGIRDIYGY
ncbi:MAG: PKD domain-containing protein [Bacteroidetes bacterium]|jgi:PKD repeat protein|nr:PKD domain-containing protein [Bacteroidota bacterium]